MSDGSVTIDTKLNQDGLKSGLGKLGSIAKGALKGVAVAGAAVATAFTGIVVASVKARGEIEQSIGGVETLFKNSADTVIKNAKNAYKTAGLSANEYMTMATSFSASLLQSVAGDTKKAADIADMAMVDMADNANKMGTDMTSIQNAYQGFAKQNYTMLDNLKLGYGGTKTEMERLLKDAQKITGIKYDINNLSDVYEAIHVIQKNLDISGYSTDQLREKLNNMSLTQDELNKVAKDMGITYEEAFNKMNDGTLSVSDAQILLGTTAREAEQTLTGSITALKASWNNFLSGAGDLSQVVDSAEIAIENILRIVADAVPSIMNNLTKSMPKLFELGTNLLQSLIDGIKANMYNSSGGRGMLSIAIDVITSFATQIIKMIPDILLLGQELFLGLVSGMAESLPDIIEVATSAILSLIDGFINNLDLIINTATVLITTLAEGLAQALPILIPKAIECIITIVEKLLDNIDMLIDAGIELIFGLADGLIEALPILIEKAPVIIQKIFDALVRNFPKIVKAGGELLGKLVMGIIGSLYKLMEVAPQLIASIVNGLKNGWQAIKDAGKNLIEGLWEGIKGMGSWVADKVKNFGKNILNNMKEALGIHSPSTLFRDQVGKNIALGVGEGFEDNISKVYRQMKSAVDFETQKLSTNLSATAMMSKVITANINVNGNVDMDGTKVGRLVAPAVSRTLRTAGA